MLFHGVQRFPCLLKKSLALSLALPAILRMVFALQEAGIAIEVYTLEACCRLSRVCRTNAGHYGISCILTARRVCRGIAVIPMASVFPTLPSVP
jgi:hypothetical protein